MPTARGDGPCAARGPCSAQPLQPCLGDTWRCLLQVWAQDQLLPPSRHCGAAALGLGAPALSPRPAASPVQSRQGPWLPTFSRGVGLRCRVPPQLSSSHARRGEQDTCLGGEMWNKTLFFFPPPTLGCSVSSCLPVLPRGATAPCPLPHRLPPAWQAPSHGPGVPCSAWGCVLGCVLTHCSLGGATTGRTVTSVAPLGLCWGAEHPGGLGRGRQLGAGPCCGLRKQRGGGRVRGGMDHSVQETPPPPSDTPPIKGTTPI